MSDTRQRIDNLVNSHKVVLFMKGTAQFEMYQSGELQQVLAR